MPKITYIHADGGSTDVEVPEGITLMEGLLRHNVPGVIAECGGACSCATCHIQLQGAWAAPLDQPEPEELELLELDERRGPGSRLSCQILVTAQLAGLVVKEPM